MRMIKRLSATAVLLLAGVASAESVDSTLNPYVMFGINRADGKLVRFEFATQQLSTLGTVQDSGLTTLKGIEAAAYFPGFDNIYALWTDPSDDKNKLVYVRVRDAGATVVNGDIPGGKFTGAAGVNTDAMPFTVFAMQTVTSDVVDASAPDSGMSISGGANINPNNSPDNEFTVTKGHGQTFTRDHLKNAAVDASGTYYQGAATLVHLKPKGNGNQNSLTVNGAPFALQNSTTYDFTGTMTVRVYNNKVKNGKAMGHWYIQFTNGSVLVNGGGADAAPVETTTARLVKLDQETGNVEVVMSLSKEYRGLATKDGKTFYTMKDADLYKLDTDAQTETKVGTTSLSSVTGMNFVSDLLMTYDPSQTLLAPLNHANGNNKANPKDVGLGDNGPILFTPADQDVSGYPVSFD
jgi:hypothetical protein